MAGSGSDSRSVPERGLPGCCSTPVTPRRELADRRRWGEGDGAAVATAPDAGWTLLHDIETAHGNIDRVLVGPAGVLMLESKRPGGVATVDAGKLIVRWRQDPADGYENDSIAGRARAAAASLRSSLRSEGMAVWVQAVVVLWTEFDQRSIERDKVAWVRGGDLTEVLAARPVKHSGEAVEHLSAATRSAVTRLRRDAERGAEF